MKHLLKIALGLVLCLGVFTACDDDDDKENGWLNHPNRG